MLPPAESSTRHAGLPPPRFGLRSLLWFVTLVGIAIVIWQAVGPRIGAALGLAAATIFLHVAGNALGNRLRDSAPTRSPSTFVPHGAAPLQRGGPLHEDHFAPVTRLSCKAPVSRRIFQFAVAVAAFSGGCGAWCVNWLYPHTANWGTLLVGGVASGAIGGVFSFWLLSLAHVLLGAWWQAHRHSEHR